MTTSLISYLFLSIASLECLALHSVDSVMQKIQKSQHLEKLFLDSVHVLQSYSAAADLEVICWLATPKSEDRQKHDETTYTWTNYTDKVIRVL